MASSSQSILEKLSSEKRFLQRRVWLCWLVQSILIVSLPLFLLTLIDRAWPVKEPTSFWLCLVVLFISTVYVSHRLVTIRRRLPDEKEVALLVEKACPELMDSLICSVELLQQNPPNLNSLNQSLISVVNQELVNKDTHTVVRAASVNSWKIIVLSLLVAAFLIGIAVFPLKSKAFAFTRDLLMGESTGLSVVPGDIEIAEGDDVKIEAQILRGPNSAEISLSNSDGNFTYDMYKNQDETSTFEVFSVDSEFDYKISTSTLQSRRYHVRTYTKPAITEGQIEIAPPNYTQLPNETLDEIKDFSVPQGSKITFLIKTNLPVRAELETSKDLILNFNNSNTLEYTSELEVNSNLGFVINLEDENGRFGSTNRQYNIECIVDFPPSIQTVSPEENAVLKADSEASFSFKVADDYGLQSVKLFLSISGTDSHEFMLYENNSEDVLKEKLIAHAFKLVDKVKNGDVISYYCAASDNALPTANVGYSDVRFIEIRPDKPEPEDQQKSPGGKIKKLQVSDLIIEQKHLIRSTWDSKRIEAWEDRTEIIQGIAKSASDLRITSSRRLAELKGLTSEEDIYEGEKRDDLPEPDGETGVDAPDADNPSDGGLIGELFREAVRSFQQPSQKGSGSLGIIGMLFDKAIQNMQKAEDFLKKNLTDESLPFQQQSLSKLVEIEIELEKNTPPPSDDGEGETGGGEKQEEVSETNEEKNKQEQAELLGKMMAALNKLIQRQKNVNDLLNRNLDNSDEEYQKFLKKKQEDVHQEAENLRAQLNGMAQANSASLELGKASRNMEKLMKNLSQSQPTNALKHGQLAKQFLERGRELLEELQENMSGDKLQQANNMLEDISKRQKDLLNETKKHADKNNNAELPPGLVDSQKNIRQNFEQFLKNLAKVTQGMGEGNPTAVRELSKALEMAANNNVSGKMKRSENALRYGRYPRAMDYQQQSGSSLSKMSDLLKSAIKQNSKMSSEQLGKMLQQVMNNASRIQKSQEGGASAAEKSDLLMKINHDFMEMAKRVNDAQMDDLSVSMTNHVLGEASSSENVDSQVLGVLYQAAQLLESQLMQSAIKKKINLTRITGQQPPDEYKKLVNEYFKNLSTVN